MASQIDDFTCRDNLLHDYSDQIADTPQVICERCVRCGHRISFYKAANGRVDNVKYARTHELETMQFEDRRWEKYYGKRKGHDQVHAMQLKANKR